MKKSAEIFQNESESNRVLRRFGLVSAALSAPAPQNCHIDEFSRLIDEDFKSFCDIEHSFNGATCHHKLKLLLEEMRLFANLPKLHSRTIGVIGGGFSSGKSAFINSLIAKGADVKLAEGILPVTAIPSYVLHSDTPGICGVSQSGSIFDIHSATYKEISHEFLKDVPYLRKIIPYTVVSAPLTTGVFDNICLIDTPGYNPAVAGTTGHDLDTARESIQDASFLVWMVGLDSNGTIPQSDLNFLTNLGFGNVDSKPLYVVISKADLKPRNDIEDIVETISECLEDWDIHPAGISAYSAKQRKVVLSKGQELFDFIKDHNVLRNHYLDLAAHLCDSFRPVLEQIRLSHEERNQLQRLVSRLRIDALRTGAIDVSEEENELDLGLSKLLEKLKSKEDLRDRTERTRHIFEKFHQCIDAFCKSIDMPILEFPENLFARPHKEPAHLPQKKSAMKKAAKRKPSKFKPPTDPTASASPIKSTSDTNKGRAKKAIAPAQAKKSTNGAGESGHAKNERKLAIADFTRLLRSHMDNSRKTRG